MAKPLDKLSIRGFKSIEKLQDFELHPLNVLIGANGAGKSNFVEFFRLLRAMVDERLQLYVARNGPADGLFFNGVAHTKRIEAEFRFGDNRYFFALEPTADGRIVIAEERTQCAPNGSSNIIGTGELESALPRRNNDAEATRKTGPDYCIWNTVSNWQVYHVHDTNMTSGMRRDVGVNQSQSLLPDASNLAAFLLALRDGHPRHYDLLRKTLQRISPHFDDFDLRVTRSSPEDTVRLMWRQKGSDYVFSPGHLSDGTIRFLCLAAALIQPNPPATIVLDEPELGLHPEALSILAGLLRSASSRMQVVLSTQSPSLVSEFEPEQVITVDQVNGASRFSRLNAAELQKWLEDFTLGELWQKGTIQGGVNHG